MTAATKLRTGAINGWPALAYGAAWIVSSAGGHWTCTARGCGATFTTSTARGKTDAQREDDAARLHAWARDEHAHIEPRSAP